MKIIETGLKGVYIADPEVHRDSRGYFMESFRFDVWEEVLGPVCFIQENESSSVKGVLRGLHYQVSPHGQSKLIRAVYGAVRDVVVDMRPKSVTFGQVHVEILDDIKKRQLFVPKGFAHGFLTLSSQAIVQYKVDAPYVAKAERTIRFDDDTLRIDWGVPSEISSLSVKDRYGLSWLEAVNNLSTDGQTGLNNS